MKMTYKALIVLAGLMTANAALAVTKVLATGPNDVTALECTQLANDIDIILSGNVVGGIDCDTSTTIIGLTTCHETGLTTERTVTNQPKAGVGVDAACAAGLTENTDGTCDGTVIGSAYPTATTAQGTVNSRFPGTDCADTNAKTEATTAVTEAAQ